MVQQVVQTERTEVEGLEVDAVEVNDVQVEDMEVKDVESEDVDEGASPNPEPSPAPAGSESRQPPPPGWRGGAHYVGPVVPPPTPHTTLALGLVTTDQALP